MEQLAAVTGQINVFLLVLTRVLGIIMTAPVLSSRNIPAQVKIGLSAIVSLSVFSVLKTGGVRTPDDLISYGMVLAGEVVVGLAIGFTANLIFSAIQLAGQAIDMQLGFSIVSVIDPIHGTSVPQMGNFKFIVALLVYLVTNTHHFMFAAIIKSYQYVPLLTYSYRPAVTNVVMNAFGGSLEIATKIALPAVGVLLITDVALGILARTVPQMNIFVVGMPLKIYVGLFVIMLALPLFGMMLSAMFDSSFTDLLKLMKAMGG
ncbi:MAG TPA: flagellar biosynthetic protein FliR [Bacillota bacterium]|nr:flagellar biosynthetic protein FliR [Bacillota bacterium]